jgi:hypothetical protein
VFTVATADPKAPLQNVCNDKYPMSIATPFCVFVAADEMFQFDTKDGGPGMDAVNMVPVLEQFSKKTVQKDPTLLQKPLT